MAPNLDEVLNRISLGISKQARILETFSKHRQASTTNTNGAIHGTTNGISRKGFSSLYSQPKSQPQSPKTTTTSSNKYDPDADLAETFSFPNTGLGFVPVSSDASKGGSKFKEEQILKTRLLGRGHDRVQAQSQGKKRGAAAADSESEEDLGRSAVGKSMLNERKKRARAEGVVLMEVNRWGRVGASRERSVAEEGQSAESGVYGNGKGEGKQSVDDVAAGEGDILGLLRIDGAAEGRGEERKKRKKNNNKKKKKKKNKKTEES